MKTIAFTRTIFTLLFAAIFILTGCTWWSQTPEGTGANIYSRDRETPEESGEYLQSGSQSNSVTPNQEYTISITRDGFSAPTVTINAGDTVKFVNKDTKPHWPASNKHPSHTLYPGSGIIKCGTTEQPKIFDACHGLQTDESFSFVFREKWEWGYHDHINPTWTGAIIVK